MEQKLVLSSQIARVKNQATLQQCLTDQKF